MKLLKNNLIREEIEVKNNRIKIIKIGNCEYISLTDLARYANPDEPKIPIQTWMRNKDVISYLGLWESVNNSKFKGHEFTTFENLAGKNSFYMSPQKWINETNAIGIISKSGNGGGTFAHSDIALEFSSWLSPEFKFYLITEFERLKKQESYQYKFEWQASRLLSKVNYLMHTDAIKEIMVPNLTTEQKNLVYSSEADILNVALFGITAREWREKNPKLAEKGNIRDYTDLLHLIVLNNLENTNAELIKLGVSQQERLVRLNDSARKQINLLKNDNRIKQLAILQEDVNKDLLLLENK